MQNQPNLQLPFMNIATWFLTVAFLAITGISLAQENLTVANVQNWWWSEQGEIDEAIFTVEPKGLYVECGMELEFSASNNNFDPADSLEVRMRFNLPCNAEVTDLWLWIEDTIMVAGIYDRWTATQLYESIVQRRIDPALLVQNGPEEYELSVFPIMTEMPRRVKITYLVPINHVSDQNPTITLPLNILQLSREDVDSVTINYFPGSNLDLQGIEDNPQVSFSQQVDPDLGTYYTADITDIGTFSSLLLKMSKTAPSGEYVGTFVDVNSNEAYYQLNLEPGELLGVSGNSKAVFLIDFVEENSAGTSSSELLNRLEAELLSVLDQYDSINIMYSGLFTNYVSFDWVPADSVSVVQMFSNIPANYATSFSNIPVLLADGINFIKTNGDEGSIVLISSANSNGNYTEANTIIQEVLTASGETEIPIHVMDLDDNNYWYGNGYYYIAGRYYKGNEYLYVNLSNLTVGEYMSVRDNSYAGILSNTIAKLSGYFEALDIYTTLQSGFTFSNYRLGCSLGMFYFDQPFSQVGKYAGTGPFDVYLSAQLQDGQLLSTVITIDSSNMEVLDSTSRTLWASKYIEYLMSYTQTNQLMNQIITTSIEHRALCRYTAFLALEPLMQLTMVDDDGNLIFTTADGGGNPTFPISVYESSADSKGYSLGHYPNPVVDASVITFEIPNSGHVQIDLYTIHGKLMANLVDRHEQAGYYEEKFDADELAAGIYYCEMKVNGSLIASRKIVVN